MTTVDNLQLFLDPNSIKNLKNKNVKSVVDFLQESIENICSITKLPFKDVLEIRQKLFTSSQGNLRSSYNLFKDNLANRIILTTGLQPLDEFFTGFEPGNIYEICGLSGSGKTQICLTTAATTALKEKCVYYIDTKGDFSAHRIKQILSKKVQVKNIVTCLERIRVNQIYNLNQLICTLHWLKNQLLYDYVPLIIIDCISTTYFSSVGSDKPVGLGLLNHVASLVKYIALEYHTIVLITNLATKNFKNNKDVLQRPVKPCLGKYWFYVCNYRLNLRKEDSFSTHISIDTNSILPNAGAICINLFDI